MRHYIQTITSYKIKIGHYLLPLTYLNIQLKKTNYFRMKTIYYNIFRRLLLLCLLLVLFMHQTKAQNAVANNTDSVVTELITDTTMCPNYKIFKKTTYSASNVTLQFTVDSTSLIKPMVKSKMLKAASAANACSADFTLPADQVEYASCINTTTTPTNLPVVKDGCGNIIIPTRGKPDGTVSEGSGCGRDITIWYISTWYFTYNDKNGHIHVWKYTLKLINPVSRTLSDGKTVHSVSECVEPTNLPIVKDGCDSAIIPNFTVTNSFNGCNGLKTYNYSYDRGCRTYAIYTYTYTITLNDFTLPANGSKTVHCLSDCVEPTNLPTIQDGLGNVITPKLTVATNFDGCNGSKIYNYSYGKHCNGTDAIYTYTYNITPTDFTLPANVSKTVHCLSDCVEPTNLPTIQDGCGNVIAPKLTITNNSDGCSGSKIYNYAYKHCNGTDTIYTYTYTISPTDFTLPANVSKTVHCLSDCVEPTNLPTIQDGCGNVITPKLTITNNSDGCSGSKIYNYAYKRCNGTDAIYTYTYTISPTDFTLPANVSKTVHCLSDCVEPTNLPTIQDGCGNVIAPKLTITNNSDGCSGSKIYNYAYKRCNGTDAIYTYTYNILNDFTLPANGSKTVHCLSECVEPTNLPTIQDGCGNVITPKLTVTNNSDGCSGSKIYSYAYKRCNGTDAIYTYTYTITPTDFTLPANVSKTIHCLSECVEPTNLPTIQDDCGNVIIPKLTVTNNFDGCSGSKIYSYAYKRCNGTDAIYTYTYTITPTDFTLPANVSRTVHCLSECVEPTNLPTIQDGCGNVITPQLTITNNSDGCSGSKIYNYAYKRCNGTDTIYTYTYNILNDFTLPANVSKTIHCLSDCVEPTNLPTIQDGCGNVITPKLTITNNFDGCSGSKIYNYAYKRCNGTDAIYTYTYTISPTDFTLPDDALKTGSNPTEAVAPGTLPSVTDDCGNVLTPSGPDISENIEGVKWKRTYTYTYTNCSGTQKQWRYSYTANKTLEKICLRSVEKVYDTRNYYVKGNLLSAAVYDSTQRVQQETRYSYYAYQVKARRAKVKKRRYDNNRYYETDIDHLTDNLVATAPLKYTENIQYSYEDNKTSSLVTSQEHYTYHTDYDPSDNRFADLKSYRHSDKGNLHEDGSGDYNYEASVDYSTDNMTQKYYVAGMPAEHVVKGMDGRIYRRSKAYYTDWVYPTHLTCLTKYLTDADTASTIVKYNNVGNIVSIKLPSQMSYKYTYDPRYSMYVSSITDTLGYTTLLGNYNYKYGVPCRKTDENGNVMLTQLDNLGRITSYTGPNEVADKVPYTIAFNYHPTVTKSGDNSISAPAYAISRHYDPANPTNDLETYTFVDGFGRAIQVKKDGVIDGQEKMIVSGRAKYDALGRVIETFYPVVEGTDKKASFNPAFDGTASTKTTYDILDRTIKTVLPDGNTTQMSFSIEGGNLKTTVTDALNHSQETYTNGSGQTVKTQQHLSNEAITTLFEYDPINQLTMVTDAKGGQTKSEYDMAGRRTQVTHPASGVTKFKYNAAGNLIEKQTANLNITGVPIKYKYDFNRLKEINYPNHPENDVKYVYGTKDEAGEQNAYRAGRLKYQEDGSGGQEFKYGKMGELTEVRRTMVIPNQAVATYVTGWKYDCWNRVQTMTYPDGEVLNYAYNTAGLLTGVTGTKGGYTYPYVKNIGYDKFEQRATMQYGNGANGDGAITTYTYNPLNRQLSNLQVLANNNSIMNNAYTYDAVSNVKAVTNTGISANGIGGGMVHNYSYDNLYRLQSANGTFTGANGKTASYTLGMGYDNLHNITRKNQTMEQTGVQFDGLLKAGYNLTYQYADNHQQISNIADSSYRYAGGESHEPILKTQQYSYDANGNMLCIISSPPSGAGGNNRKMLWDEENRLLALSDNGFVSNYWYDAAGERTVKTSGDGEGIYVNGVLSGARTGTSNFTAYVSPYTVVGNGGQMSKHIYMGSQRIVSKLCNSGTMADPTIDIKAGAKDFTAKYALQTASIKTRYDSLGVTYRGKDNAGVGFYTAANSAAKENLQYFYHSDHLGSSSLITDIDGNVAQHIEYIPFGEVFVEERNNSWKTPYKFNGKELDEETGLYYYGARYMDPRTSVWLSVDPLAEKYPTVSSYVYCVDNPIKFIDPDGKEVLCGYKYVSDNLFLLKGATRMKAVEDPKVIHIYAHGNSGAFEFFSNGKSVLVENAQDMKKLLDSKSKNWQKRNNNAEITIVLHSCSTGKEVSEDNPSIARQISDSKDFKDVTIIAPNNDVPFNKDGYEIGPLKENKEEGKWITYKNGKQIDVSDGSKIPGVDNAKTPLPRTNKDTDTTKKNDK
jgi:RHS repeat-associated protein